MAATLVLADSKVLMIRGAAMYTVTPGVRIHEGDILATDAKGQAQLQFVNGGLVNAGGDTQLLVARAPRGGDAEIGVLSGWIKFDHKKAAAPVRFGYLARGLRVAADEAAAVLHVGESSIEAFVESGSIKLFVGGDREGRAVKVNEFVVLKSGQPPVFAPRPAAEFIKAMPRHFRDPLPSLADKFKDRKIDPKRERDVSYGDVEGWLKADLPLRKGFVKRFQVRAHDAEFRAGLVKNVRSHPEWDPVLFPERYEVPERKPGEDTTRERGVRQ